MHTIGILSDTHGWLDPELIAAFSDCDSVLHAGDIGENIDLTVFGDRIKAVFGNIDSQPTRQIWPEYQVLDVEGCRILMVHIAGKFPRYSPLAARLIRLHAPQLLICGHSHICRVVHEGGLLYVNPGAAGRSGFHSKRTALKMKIDNGKPVELRVLDLGKRSKL